MDMQRANLLDPISELIKYKEVNPYKRNHETLKGGKTLKEKTDLGCIIIINKDN